MGAMRPLLQVAAAPRWCELRRGGGLVLRDEPGHGGEHVRGTRAVQMRRAGRRHRGGRVLRGPDPGGARGRQVLWHGVPGAMARLRARGRLVGAGALHLGQEPHPRLSRAPAAHPGHRNGQHPPRHVGLCRRVPERRRSRALRARAAAGGAGDLRVWRPAPACVRRHPGRRLVRAPRATHAHRHRRQQ